MFVDALLNFFLLLKRIFKKKNLRGKKPQYFKGGEKTIGKQKDGNRSDRKRWPSRHGNEQTERATQRTD